MSEVLARLRVKEEHGIRRFFYPLNTVLRLKPSMKPPSLGLFSAEGKPIPLQAAPVFGKHGNEYRLDFGISIAPFSEEILSLIAYSEPLLLDDPLHPTFQADGTLHNTQKQFSVTVGKDASLRSVIYDRVSHLGSQSTILRNSEVMHETEGEPPDSEATRSNGPLTAGVSAYGQYSDVKSANTNTEITACKSWATLTHWLEKTQPNDEIVFTLPFAATSPVLTYDLGLDGIYGKLERTNNDQMKWQMEHIGKDLIQWSVAINDRTDYTGTMTQPWFQEKRWFHLVDGSKALAVAITHVPKLFRELVITIENDGNIRVGFLMRRDVEQGAMFGVCYHFLNDIPAIAAATNPQSILLSPTVEVLPA